MHKNNKKGFTIVELVIVIAVIAILAAVLIPTFANLAKRANISADTQLIRNLNTALISDSAKNGKHTTMQSALDAAEKFGYDVARINASATDNEILWDSANDVFCYFNAETEKIEYIPEFPGAKEAKPVDYWVISNTYDAAKGYSVYLYEYTDASTESEPLVISTGLDTGKESVAFVKYENGTDQTVTIRTNSASTTLIIADSSEGTIYHYGSAGALNIIQCHTASYHENGDIAFAEIAKGRIVLESGSEIKHIHVDKKDNASFDTVIIADNGAKALPEKITRDEVTVTTETLVVTVESNGSSEEVYVYANGSTGSTQKVTEGENKQNEDVNSALGQLVLDNGEESKALSDSDKDTEKAVVVAEAKQAEEAATDACIVGNASYKTLEDAFEALADDANAEIVLNKNITIKFDTEAYISIKKDQNISIDLNGNSIDVVATRSGSTAFIKNQGTLVLKDSSASDHGIGNGKITFLGTDPDTQGVPGYASNLISNYGNITIESGVYENQIQAGYASYALDNYPGGTAIINGGRFIQSAERTYAVRMFCSSITDSNNLTINDGIIEGGYALWMQYLDNDGASKASLTINDGTFIARDGFCLYASSNSGASNASNINIKITGGNFGGTGVVMKDTNNTAGAYAEITGGTYQGLIAVCGKQLQLGEDPGFKAIPEGYTLRDNGNGTFTVVPE